MNLRELTALAFAPGGPLSEEMSKIGRTYTPNAEQISYACTVATSFDTAKIGVGEVSLLEAETGVGKSLGYLIPMALHVARCHTRGLVSTFTLALQDQLMRKDMPLALAVAKSMTGKTVKAAIRKGMRNFFSPSRIAAIIAAMKAEDALTGEAKEALTALYKFAVENGDVAQWKEFYGPIPLGLADSDVTVTPMCSGADSARYKAHIAESHDADIVVTNHALTMLSALRWNRVLSGRDGFDVGVIDEADRLPDAAGGVFNTRVSGPMIRRAIDAIEPFIPVLSMGRVQSAIYAWQGWMDETYYSLMGKHGFFQEERGGYALLASGNLSAVRASAVEHALKMADALHTACIGIVERGAAQDVVDEVRSYVEELKQFAKVATDAKDGEHSAMMSPILRWSPVRSFPSLSVVPVYPGRLAGRLFRPGKIDGEETPPFLRSLVCTSATLDAPARTAEEGDADFKSFRTEIGLWYQKDKPEDARHLSPDRCHRFAPRDFGRWDSMVLSDRAAPRPTLAVEGEEEVTTDPQWLAYAASGIVAAHRQGGRVLALATSFKDTEALAEVVRFEGVEVIEHKRGTKLADMLDSFTATPNAILITPSGWEGLDLPGMIDHLIVTRMPFPPVDSARNGARAAVLAGRGVSAEAIKAINYASTVTATKKKLKQGLGRLVRSKTDHGKVWILDPRFPLPQKLVSNRRARAYNDASFSHFSDCIPERFRSGFDDVFSSAEVHPYFSESEVAA